MKGHLKMNEPKEHIRAEDLKLYRYTLYWIVSIAVIGLVCLAWGM